MADYKSMYYTLFNKVTDVIGDLQEIQQLCEQMYIESEEKTVNIRLAEKTEKEANDSKQL
ncbi:MAG: hypothetical protein E7483_06445 [Ruminococcaceae bacterium]|nr:hypothetical protein [Oscillospiraceae bacterium]